MIVGLCIEQFGWRWGLAVPVARWHRDSTAAAWLYGYGTGMQISGTPLPPAHSDLKHGPQLRGALQQSGAREQAFHAYYLLIGTRSTSKPKANEALTGVRAQPCALTLKEL
jgi:hypothetical protein